MVSEGRVMPGSRPLCRRLPAVAALCSLLVVCFGCGRHEADLYTYPDFALPVLGNDHPITELNRELCSYSRSFATATCASGAVNLSSVTGFRFSSEKGFGGDTYCFLVPVTVNGGKCRIDLGSVGVVIAGGVLSIHDHGTLLQTVDVPSDILLSVEKFRPGNKASVSVRDRERSTFVSSLPVSVPIPAHVDVTLDGAFSGTVGPWVWLRKYE